MNRIFDRIFSLKKNAFGLGMVILFMYAGESLGKMTVLDSLKVSELADSIKQFEAQCFDSMQIGIAQYHRGLGYYDQMIDLMLQLAPQSIDRNYEKRALGFVERKKNLKLLMLLRSGHWPMFFLSADPSEHLLTALNRIQMATRVGNSLLNAMKHPFDLATIQSNSLEDKQAIINFWVNQDRIVAFVIGKDSLSVVQWHFPRNLIENKIGFLMKPFYNSTNPFKLDFSAKTAYELYKLLFQPLEAHLRNVRSICLIPDEMLYGFPFELLLCSAPTPNSAGERALYQNLGALDYLIRHYDISYNYSTAVLALINESYRSMKALRHRLLTMSEPVTRPASEVSSWAPSLWHNDYEAEEIKRVSRLLFRHDNLRQRQANKTYFLSGGQNYRWIHLTLPAPLDNTNAFNSGVVFSYASDDSVGSSAWLAIEEILQGNFSADLLTMGNSQLVSFSSHGNPGVIALPQAFLLAGVRSVLLRLWPINSLATSQYLAKFYWELKYKRQPVSQALQQAKVASLKETFIVDAREVSRAHPFFWAGFQLVGNPQISPPSPTKLPPMAVVGLVYVVVILVSLAITRKTMPKRRL